jgi:hypothetical protein
VRVSAGQQSAAAPLARPPADGRPTYAPPTFTALVADATASLAAALQDGKKLVEVEFPALPGDKDGEKKREEREKIGNARHARLCPTRSLFLMKKKTHARTTPNRLHRLVRPVHRQQLPIRPGRGPPADCGRGRAVRADPSP